MSIMTYRESVQPRTSQSSFATYVGLARSIVSNLRDAWRRRQNEQVLEGLPPEIRKDIGWPSTDNDLKRH
ncbi:hypothetical protein [Neorhizobium sp. DAR64860/K0K1]|uniref:hypothetical protein n=1 Tax=Neorhizobium sp. DAR64860/K0K1 TaxID=3421955 RepID=UPI003D294A2A